MRSAKGGGWRLSSLWWLPALWLAVGGAMLPAQGVDSIKSRSAAVAAARKPVLRIALDGSAPYRSVAEALAAAPATGAVLRIAPGTYREKLRVESNGIELRGEGRRPEDVVLVWGDSAAMAGGTGKSASLTVTGDDFVATDLTVQNDWETNHERTHEGSQAVALMLTGDRAVLRHVRLLGFQDTLYAASKTCHAGMPEGRVAAASDAAAPPCQASRQLYADCYIEGHVDFIFGDAKAAFSHCELHALASPTVMFTAQSRMFPAEDSGYLFRDCTITAAPGAGRLLLGRPWRAYATVDFIDTQLDAVTLAPEGWSEWDGRLATASYAEYRTGPGADVSKRIAGTRQLTTVEAAKLTVRSWLAGTDGWNAEAVR